MESPLERRQVLKWQLGVTTAAFCSSAGESMASPGQRGTKEGAVEKLKAPGDDARSTGLLADPIYKLHQTGRRHPERPERCDAVLEALTGTGLLEKVTKLERRVATEDEILLCHSPRYLRTVKDDIASNARMLSTGDTQVSERSLEIALEASGGILNAVDAVLGGKFKNAFSVVRPPGHHATPERGMGFCIFNNVAIAARYAQQQHGVGNVLIADWDVHHGNGTQDIFYRDASVFFFSTHQSPWYPGTGMEWETGEGSGRGTTLNCPFPAGSGRREILGVFRKKLLPAAKQFKPDVVFISAGFDSRQGDPLGQFTLSDEDFAELTQTMLQIASDSAGGRLISVLEGGYNLSGLGTAAAAHVEALCGA